MVATLLSRSSFSRKLVLSYLLIIFIPMLLGGVAFTIISESKARSDYLNTIQSNLDQVVYNMTGRIDSIAQMAQSIVQDNTLIDLLSADMLDDSYIVGTVNYSIISKLTSYKNLTKDIETLRIVHSNPSIPNVYDYMYYDATFTDDWLQIKKTLTPVRLEDYFLEGFFEPEHEKKVFFQVKDEQRKPVYSFYFPIFSHTVSRFVGYVEITMKTKDFLSSLEYMDIGNDKLLLRMDNGTVLYYSSDDELPGVKQLSTNNTMVKEMPFIGGKLYRIVAPGFLSYRTTLPILGAYLVVGTVTLFLFACLQSRILLSNLFKLTNAIRRVSNGELTSRVVINSGDEFQQLAEDFNDMTEKLAISMKKTEEANHAEKEAIYKALENQIKPHFFCNALDMIRMTAETSGNAAVSGAISLVARYYMYNMSKTGKYTSLMDELKNAKDYLEIQNLIRSVRIRFDLNISPEMRDRLECTGMLKFVLQPLIENCVKHGFAAKTGGCYVHIRVFSGNETIGISVEDNGSGIPEDRLAAILRSGGECTSEEKEIGIANIRKRLALNYGEAASLSIESYPGVGTNVTISFPAESYLEGVGNDSTAYC